MNLNLENHENFLTLFERNFKESRCFDSEWNHLNIRQMADWRNNKMLKG